MDWTKLNETIDPRWHEINVPLPGYHSPKDPEAKQIYISTAGIHNNTYDLLMRQYREYVDKLAFQMSCSAPTPTYIKVSEDFAHYLEANHKYEMSYKTDDIPSGVYGHWTGIPIMVDDTLKDKHYEFEFKDEQAKQKFERGLRAKELSLYNDVMTENGLSLMTNEEIEAIADKWNSIGCTSFMLTSDKLNQLFEQTAEENKND